jgi:hypothetical protein
MTFQAQCASVRKPALAPAFADRQYVIGVPKLAARAPLLFELPPGRVVELALVFAQRLGIEAAPAANATVALPDLFAKISGVRA